MIPTKKTAKKEKNIELMSSFLGWTFVIAFVIVIVYLASQLEKGGKLVCDTGSGVSLTSFGSCRTVEQ